MPLPALSIRRATSDDLPSLHALLQLYYSEGDVHHTEDEQSLHATINQHPYGFFLAEVSPTPDPAPPQIIGCVLYRSPGTIPHAAECKRLFSSSRNSAATTSPPASWTPSKTPPATPASVGSTSTAKKSSRPPSPCTAAAATPTAPATTKTATPPSFSVKISHLDETSHRDASPHPNRDSATSIPQCPAAATGAFPPTAAPAGVTARIPTFAKSINARAGSVCSSFTFTLSPTSNPCSPWITRPSNGG